MIISRYLIKEVLASLLAVTVVLLLIFLSNQLVRYLSYAASGKIAANVVLQLLGFEIPYLLSLLLPLGLYLGIMLAYGRLYADSEMPVLNASGLGIKRLIAITSVLAIAIAGLMVVLMMWVNPSIAVQKGKSLAQSNMLDTLQPGRFQVLGGGKRVVYVEQISRNRKQANNLFLAEEKKSPNDDSKSWVVLAADHGFQTREPVTHDKFIVSVNGYRYEGVPGENAFKIVQFQKYAVRVPTPSSNSAREEEEAVPTLKLWHDYANPAAAAELQWRLSLPISVLVLALLAIPLSQVRPRQGRYSHILPAMLIYIVYTNLLFIARNWVEMKMIPSIFGMWWVHLTLLLVAIILLVLQRYYQLRSFSLPRFRRKPA